MIKIVHIGDLHIGGTYQEKAAASIDFLMEQLENPDSPAFHPDLIVCTGDTTEKALQAHAEELKPLLRLISRYQAIPYCATKLIFLQGTPSHEKYEFLPNLREASGGMITVMDHPEIIRVDCGQGRTVHLAALPALNKPMLAKWSDEFRLDTPDFADIQADVIVQSIMSLFHENWERSVGPKILLGHWTIAGCTTATGQTLQASDLSVGLNDLELCHADAIMVGHIHKVQRWDIDGDNTVVSYCGSSHPCNWGEMDPKSFNVWEFDDVTGKVTALRQVTYPHRPMVEVAVDFTGKQVDGDWEYIISGENWPLQDTNVDLKVVYMHPKEIAAQIDDPKLRVIFHKLGFEVTKLDRIQKSNCRERVEGITSMMTTRSQYVATCQVKGVEPREGALAEADLIDEEVEI